MYAQKKDWKHIPKMLIMIVGGGFLLCLLFSISPFLYSKPNV